MSGSVRKCARGSIKVKISYNDVRNYIRTGLPSPTLLSFPPALPPQIDLYDLSIEILIRNILE